LGEIVTTMLVPFFFVAGASQSKQEWLRKHVYLAPTVFQQSWGVYSAVCGKKERVQSLHSSHAEIKNPYCANSIRRKWEERAGRQKESRNKGWRKTGRRGPVGCAPQHACCLCEKAAVAHWGLHNILRHTRTSMRALRHAQSCLWMHMDIHSFDSDSPLYLFLLLLILLVMSPEAAWGFSTLMHFSGNDHSFNSPAWRDFSPRRPQSKC